MLSGLVDRALKTMEFFSHRNAVFEKYHGQSLFVDEYRTIALQVPRQSGKTTELIKILESDPGSYIFLVHSRDAVLSNPDLRKAPHVIVNTKGSGGARGADHRLGKKVFKGILVDEPELQDKESIKWLKEGLIKKGMVSNDFYILKLGS